ncbi:MAG TPA: hypothetical protein VHT02_06160, partial [Methylocella sp.]|nr:hypothetical protein [Methylocella sp.]
MNEAHLEAKAPDRFPADPSAAQDHFVLREDLRRVSVPIDQFGSWRMHGLSFALLVVLPVLCTAIYYGLIAAGKYSVEFRFSVRPATELVADDDNIAPMIRAGKSGTREIRTLPYMAADYLRSRNVVRELDSDGWLRSLFSRDQADWLSRFDPSKSDDDLWHYWREMIIVSVDRVSVPIDQFESWRMRGLSFALLVVLPVLCAYIYYGLIAAGKYAVEFRFSVRSATELVADEDNIALMITAGKPGKHDAGSLPYMAADYLRSRNVVRELDSDGWLRSLFSRDQTDWLSRFNPLKSDDDLWHYWREMISVSVD